MMRTCVRAGRIQTHAAPCVRTHVRIKTAKKSYMQNSNPLKYKSRLLPPCYALGKRESLFYKGSRKPKSSILRVDDKYIVLFKNEVLNGNSSAVIRQQKEFTEIYHFKARKELILWETGFILKMR